MNDTNEKLRKLAHLRDIKRLELEYLLAPNLPFITCPHGYAFSECENYPDCSSTGGCLEYFERKEAQECSQEQRYA